MHLLIRSISTTRCDDLARATEAQDGKKSPGLAPPGGASPVDQPRKFLQEITRVLDDQKTHPILEQMLQTLQGDSKKEASSSASRRRRHQSTDDVRKLTTTGGVPWLVAFLLVKWGVGEGWAVVVLSLSLLVSGEVP